MAATGKKPGGKPPAPPVPDPRPADQVNLTDEDSRIMSTSAGGFEQSYNTQPAVPADSFLVVAVDFVQAPNDKQRVAPMLGEIGALPAGLGQVDTLLADAGYFSDANVASLRGGRRSAADHGRAAAASSVLHERFVVPPPAPENPGPTQAVVHRLPAAGRCGPAVHGVNDVVHPAVASQDRRRAPPSG